MYLNIVCMNDTIFLPPRKAIKLRCQRCHHEWYYTGNNRFICSCPFCKTSVTITKKNKNSSHIVQIKNRKHLLNKAEGDGHNHYE